MWPLPALLAACVPADTGAQAKPGFDTAEAWTPPHSEDTATDTTDSTPTDTECAPSDWYFDGDGDGHGAGSPTSACVAPDRHVALGDDCVDDDPTIHPGADEACADGIDQDCDGADRSCPWTGEVPLGILPKLYAPNPDEDAGRLLDAGDATGDGIADLFVSTWGASGYAGGGYLVPGPVGAAGSLASLGYTFTGDVDLTYGAGRAIGVDDIDGDGIMDLAFGVPYATECGVYVFTGPITEGGLVATPDLRILGDRGTFAGHGADLGDLSGDGIADAVIGAYHTSETALSAGAVHIVYGPIVADLELYRDADRTLHGEGAEYYTGRHLQIAGDINADGLRDMLIVAPNGTGMTPNSGIVYVVYGPGDIGDMGSADGRLLGEMPGAALGTGVAVSSGDVDGDGYDDVAAGAYYDATAVPYGGAAYLVHGPAAGDVPLESADVVVRGAAENQYAGSAVALGDLDGDARADFVVGAYGTNTSTGAAYLYYAPGLGTLALDEADATFVGEGIIQFAGANTLITDLTADGRAELLIGAVGEPTGGADAGAVYVGAPGL